MKARLLVFLRLDRLRHIPWLVGSLGSALVLLLLLSLNTDSWRPEAPALLWYALGGAILAVLLSRTRWGGLGCLVYTLLLAFAAAAQQIGEIVPLLKGLSLSDWLVQLNWQFFLFFERLQAWIQIALTMKPIQDPAWLNFWLILEIWLGVAWLVWVIRRMGQVWLASLPILLLMAIPVQNGHSDSLYLVLALFLVLSLSALKTYQGLQKNWNTNKLDYPDGLWQDWLVAALVICLLVLPAAHTAPLLTTAEGWQKIETWYDEIRTTAKRGETAGSGTGQRPASISSANALDHLLSGPDVTRVGAPLPQNDKLAMWIRVGDPTPRPWRTAIYSTYTGTGWLEAPLEETPVASLEEPLQAPLGSKILKQSFILVGSYNENLFAAGEPLRVVGEGIDLRAVAPDGSNVLRGKAHRYEVWSLVPNIRPENLSLSSVDYPSEIQETYLQLPEDLPARVSAQARRVVSGKDNTLERVVAVQTFLRGLVPYDLNTPLPPAGQDVVDYFLFDAPSGFCSYYASSMTVMLRAVGIPARVVTGYAAGSYILQQGIFQVPGNAAHAWVEVYFPDFGWIPFEPTPSQEIPYYARVQEVIEPPAAVSRQSAIRQLFWMRLGLGLLFAALGIGAGILGVRTWNTQRSIARQSGHPLVRQYLMLRYRLQRAGFEITATQTPREVCTALEPQLTEVPHIQAALQRSTLGVEKVLYGTDLPLGGEVRAMRSMLRACWREWIRLGWKRMRK